MARQFLAGTKEMPASVKHAAVPTITAAYPQLFVADIEKACGYYGDKLGFMKVFTYGTPPFYGQVKRDGARLNLRHVDVPLFDSELREREMLLSAYLPVENIEALFDEYKAKGVSFRETLATQPWGARQFLVRDLDGNLIAFASA